MEQILLINSIPALGSRYISYGSRTSSPLARDSSTTKDDGLDTKPAGPAEVDPLPWGRLNRILDAVATIQVPHAWFIHFYFVSVASSLFWIVQIFTQGPYLKAIAEMNGPQNRSHVMTADQAITAWALMGTQGIRRLLESVTITKKASESKMFIAHWFLGIGFYLAMGVAVWIEGIGEEVLTRLGEQRVRRPAEDDTKS